MRSTSVPHTARALLAAVVTSATAAVTLLASPAAAQIAPGSTLRFTGTADASDLGSSGVLLDFDEHVTALPSGNTGAFAPLDNQGEGATGSIESLTVGSGPQPIGKVLHLGGFSFDLTHVPSGSYGQDDCYVAPAVGQRCTPYQFPSYELSPFYLENTAASGSDALFTALVSFDVSGTVTGRGSTSDFFGTITATFEGLSYQEALAGLEQQGLRDVPFTATFVAGTRVVGVRATALAATTSVVPEPSTLALMATGLLTVGAAAYRRRRATD